MTLPIFHSVGQILQSLIQEVPVDGIVGLVQDSFGRLTTINQVGLGFFVLSLLVQVLGYVSQVVGAE